MKRVTYRVNLTFNAARYFRHLHPPPLRVPCIVMAVTTSQGVYGTGFTELGHTHGGRWLSVSQISSAPVMSYFMSSPLSKNVKNVKIVKCHQNIDVM